MTGIQVLKDSVRINEVSSAPLSDYVIGFLKSQNKENPYLDFKLTIDIAKGSDFPEIVKDILAFSNYGCGWILIGWQEKTKNVFTPIGLSDQFQLDQATLQEKFNSYVTNPIELLYREVTLNIEGVDKRFGFIYIPPSYEKLVPIKEGKYLKADGNERTVFEVGKLFYRRGTQSIKPSSTEIALIEKRLRRENYRLSVLSGEPDEIDEEIFSNLFEVKKIPEYIYSGIEKPYDNNSIKALLKEKGVFPEFYHKFKEWDNKVVTFENIADPNNSYSSLVEKGTVKCDTVSSWLNDTDKSRIIFELFNKELIHYAISRKFYFDSDHGKLFYPLKENDERRSEQWQSPYRQSTKSVAARMYAEQLGMWVYWHPAFKVAFVNLKGRFYMRILPTFAITSDGKKSISDPSVGSIITRLSYNKYNDSYLSTVRFWAQKLITEDQSIKIMDYLEIATAPTSSKLPVGILFEIYPLQIAD